MAAIRVNLDDSLLILDMSAKHFFVPVEHGGPWVSKMGPFRVLFKVSVVRFWILVFGGPGGPGSPYGFMCYLLRAPEVLLNVRNHHLALLIVFWIFYYSICLGGLGGLQRPMWSLLRASMVLLKVREHLYLTLWRFSKGFVTLTFKNFITKSGFFTPINRTNGALGAFSILYGAFWLYQSPTQSQRLLPFYILVISWRFCNTIFKNS